MKRKILFCIGILSICIIFGVLSNKKEKVWDDVPVKEEIEDDDEDEEDSDDELEYGTYDELMEKLTPTPTPKSPFDVALNEMNIVEFSLSDMGDKVSDSVVNDMMQEMKQYYDGSVVISSGGIYSYYDVTEDVDGYSEVYTFYFVTSLDSRVYEIRCTYNTLLGIQESTVAKEELVKKYSEKEAKNVTYNNDLSTLLVVMSTRNYQSVLNDVKRYADLYMLIGVEDWSLVENSNTDDTVFYIGTNNGILKGTYDVELKTYKLEEDSRTYQEVQEEILTYNKEGNN